MTTNTTRECVETRKLTCYLRKGDPMAQWWYCKFYIFAPLSYLSDSPNAIN